MTAEDKRISDLVKELEQTVSFRAALVAARDYIKSRSFAEDFNSAVFVESLAPHLLSHHITGECF